MNKSTTRWLGIMIVLQILILLTLWLGGPAVSVAHADGIPDAGEQRDQMIQQQRATNEKLDKILDLLSKGELQVKLTKPDESK
jgi:hypothetical protein